jgi:hypothetical protein
VNRGGTEAQGCGTYRIWYPRVNRGGTEAQGCGTYHAGVLQPYIIYTYQRLIRYIAYDQ